MDGIQLTAFVSSLILKNQTQIFLLHKTSIQNFMS